jgi:hypothetical protein
VGVRALAHSAHIRKFGHKKCVERFVMTIATAAMDDSGVGVGCLRW